MSGAAGVSVIRTGCANVASVLAALRRAGVEGGVTDRPEVVESAAAVVLPGVGAFGPARAELRSRGLDEAVVRRAEAGRPLLAVCLGFQLLLEGSEEAAGERGLGVIAGVAGRFGRARVPQLGWNAARATGDARLLESGFVYFANSYRLESLPAGWEGAYAEHGEPFVAAAEKGDVLACQFHPELSGAFGQRLIERWLRAAGAIGGASC